MPRKSKCKVCGANEAKYTCARCSIRYCSANCYKDHKGNPLLETHTCFHSVEDQSCRENSEIDTTANDSSEQLAGLKKESGSLRPLTSLKWPYVPEPPAYADPLERDNPKPLQLHQYEAIATSPAIREILATYPNLPSLLTSIDNLRGINRERALRNALGVTSLESSTLSDDTFALRALAEAIETAVRGPTSRGLDWEEVNRT